MFIDAENQFSDKQTLSSTGYSTNSVEIPPGLVAGAEMAVQVVVRSESGSSPTLTVELEASADDSTYTKVVGMSKPANDRIFAIGLNNVSGLKKYLRLRYVLGGSSPEYNITAMLVAGDGFSSKGVHNCADSPRQA